MARHNQATVARRGIILSIASMMIAILSLSLVVGTATAAPGGGHGEYPNSDKFNWFDINYANKDADGGWLEEGEEQMSPPFILMLMNFAIVLFIIGWKFAPPVRKFARGRHDSVKQALEEASLLREQAKAKLEEYNDKVAEAQAEVDKMIEDIRSSAEADKKRVMDEAEAQAAAMKRDAEERIAADLARARVEIEREVVAAAVAAAEKLIREGANQGDQTRLIDKFISDMKDQVKHSEERA